MSPLKCPTAAGIFVMFVSEISSSRRFVRADMASGSEASSFEWLSASCTNLSSAEILLGMEVMRVPCRSSTFNAVRLPMDSGSCVRSVEAADKYVMRLSFPIDSGKEVSPVPLKSMLVIRSRHVKLPISSGAGPANNNPRGLKSQPPMQCWLSVQLNFQICPRRPYIVIWSTRPTSGTADEQSQDYTYAHEANCIVGVQSRFAVRMLMRTTKHTSCSWQGLSHRG